MRFMPVDIRHIVSMIPADSSALFHQELRMNPADLQKALTDHFSSIDEARRRIAEEDTVRLHRSQEIRRKFVAYAQQEVRPALQLTGELLQSRGYATQLTEHLDPSPESSPASIRLRFAARPGDAPKTDESSDFFIEAKLADNEVVRITYTQREGNIHPVRSTDYALRDAPTGKALQVVVMDCVRSCYPVPEP
jgi:hypothetical protein